MDVNKLTTIQSVVGMNCFKFDVLDEAFKDIKIEQDEVTLFIDLYMLICHCYSEQFAKKIERADSTVVTTDFVVSIMNALGHYKFYVVKRLKKKCSIVLMHNTKLTKYQNKFDVDYRWDRIHKLSTNHPKFGYMNKLITTAYKMIQRVCIHIEDVHVLNLDPGLDSAGCVYFFRNHSDHFRNSYHIVCSRTLSAIQLIQPGKCSVLYPKSRMPYILTEDTYLRYGLGNRLGKIRNTKLPYQFIPFLCVIGGCEHVLPTLKTGGGLSGAIKIINEMYQKGLITKNISFPSFIEILEEYMIKRNKKKKKFDDEEDDQIYYSNDDFNRFIDRYRVFSAQLNVAAATKSQKTAIESNLVYIYNQDYLDSLVDLLSKINDPDRLIDFDKLNAQRTTIDDDYNGEWW